MRPDPVRRVLDAELTAARERRGGQPPRLLDVGGGSGVLAVPLAAAGAEVTVVEPSPNALATLDRRAEDAGVAHRITAVQGDSDALDQLVGPGFDLVIAHGVLEVVDDPKVTVAALAAAVAPGGAVSVVVANRFAAVIQRAISGKLTDARQLLDGPAVPGEPRRFDTVGLHTLLDDAGLTVHLVQGLGVLTDLVPGGVLESNLAAAEALADLEATAATMAPLRDIATRLHALARR
ncbi:MULTISPECIES: class I SAM-dependent methyltransferase [Actinokineospora]|uniref:Methyltransferase n=1 Tax=Actinokineospora fastidiosa TaxID=1816 RepID=A0A918LEJ0_9PSEU|nr:MULTISPECIES: class I SAM-dependent methyltransferase [Actinokineospora]UVS80972.1 3-demethylubiquinone-9 3-methyltransferase [Actinokineospora sp. UTMC 2448]GGS38635.1 methyltransferase [Actinokineospora fastidiosa]